MMIGISIKPTIGIGDALQFSSVPENYFRATGRKLVDVSKPWFFDSNPFVERDYKGELARVQEMWNFSPRQYSWPTLRTHGVYLSNAEIHASVFGVPVSLNRPRLYRFEDFPFHERQRILFQTEGRSHGRMPEHIINHVMQKYGPTRQLFHIGPGDSYGLPHIETPTLWELADVISKARMVVALDSGPAWVAACYPDVLVKKVRTKPTDPDAFKTWVPLSVDNIHSHWDDRCHQIFNVHEEDQGFTSTYRKL